MFSHRSQPSAHVLLVKCDSFTSHGKQRNIFNFCTLSQCVCFWHCSTLSVRKCVDSASRHFRPQEKILPPDQLLIFSSSCLCSCHRCLSDPSQLFMSPPPPLLSLSYLVEIHFEACALLSLSSCSQASRGSKDAASSMAFCFHLLRVGANEQPLWLAYHDKEDTMATSVEPSYLIFIFDWHFSLMILKS